MRIEVDIDGKITEHEDAPIVEKSEEELKLQYETEQEQKRKDLMLQGSVYKGHQISFTKDDGDGVVQVKSAFEVGLPATVLHFDCGTTMTINAEDFSEFALWFVKERNKFFIGE